MPGYEEEQSAPASLVESHWLRIHRPFAVVVLLGPAQCAERGPV